MTILLLYLRSPKGGCCSISDDLSCSSNFHDVSLFVKLPGPYNEQSKIEKVPRVLNVKFRKRHGKLWKTGLNNWSNSQKGGQNPCVRKCKLSLLAWHTHCICSMETTRNSVNVKFSIQVLKLLESLIGWEVTVTGQRSECHFIFARGKLHIAE